MTVVGIIVAIVVVIMIMIGICDYENDRGCDYGLVIMLFALYKVARASLKNGTFILDYRTTEVRAVVVDAYYQ